MIKSTEERLIDSSEIDRMIADAIEMIGFRTANPPGNETELAQWLALRTSELGMKSTVTEVSGGRANCIAKADFGPGPTVILCTHLDVVPANGEAAWRGTVRDGRLYGRGACDAKGPLAAMLAACARLLARDDLCGTVILAAVADEETGATGAIHFTESMELADAVIIGEPTNNLPVLSSRGALRLAIDFDGRPAHSSTPVEGRNAVHAAARFIVAGEKYHHQLSENGQSATFATTVVSGGTKFNIIPAACRILVDRRLAPGESLAGALCEVQILLETLRENDPELTWTISEAGVGLEPFEISSEDGFGFRILRALGESSAGPVFPGGTDAPHFVAKGIPAVILGPGALAQAHSDNEWVEVADLAAAVDLYERAVVEYLSSRQFLS